MVASQLPLPLKQTVFSCYQRYIMETSGTHKLPKLQVCVYTRKEAQICCIISWLNMYGNIVSYQGNHYDKNQGFLIKSIPTPTLGALLHCNAVGVCVCECVFLIKQERPVVSWLPWLHCYNVPFTVSLTP